MRTIIEHQDQCHLFHLISNYFQPCSRKRKFSRGKKMRSNRFVDDSASAHANEERRVGNIGQLCRREMYGNVHQLLKKHQKTPIINTVTIRNPSYIKLIQIASK